MLSLEVPRMQLWVIFDVIYTWKSLSLLLDNSVILILFVFPGAFPSSVYPPVEEHKWDSKHWHYFQKCSRLHQVA